MKKRGIIIGTVGAGLVIAVAAGLVGYFYESAISRNPKLIKKGKEWHYSDDPEKQEAYEKAKAWVDGIKKEELEICSFDGLRLHGTFIPAKNYTATTVVLVHGYRVGWFKDFGLMLKFYHEFGVNILLPDDRGHGESEGSYIGFGWHDHFDVEKWVEYLLVRFGENSNIFLHGVSMGAATVMIASGDDLPPQVKGIIEDCGYSTLDRQLKYNLTKGKNIPVSPLINAVSKVASKKVGYKFSDCDSIKALKKTALPYLFIHGDKDRFVPTEMVYENYDACASEDKEIVLIEGAKHAESYYVDNKTYEKAVVDFITNHIA